MASSIVLGVPPAVLELYQQGLLERAFHDGLFPSLQYRAEFLKEEWPANTGTELVMSRAGLLNPITRPLTPGSDPVPQTIPFEQWVAILQQFAGTVDTHVPTSAVANANLFLRNVKQLGLQAGQSVNRVARNSLFKAYSSGNTAAKVAILSADTTISVASLNGFTDVVVPGTNVRPAPVSSSNPLPILIGPGAGTAANVIGTIPDDPADPAGPGTLQLAASVGAGFAIRTTIRSKYAARIVRSAAGDSVDAIGASDTFTLQQAINAVAYLRQANVQPHEDGFYHAHISPLANSQVFADPVFQRLNQSLPEHVIYKEGFIGTISGVMFFMNAEAPNDTNSGTLISTGNSAMYGSDIGAEVVNSAGIKIGRVIITGKGVGYEKMMDEGNYVTEAGTMGKIGDFNVVNNGVSILTEGIRLVMRSPIDRLQQMVSCSWSISTSFPIPSDVTAPSGNERFKRALILEHAL